MKASFGVVFILALAVSIQARYPIKFALSVAKHVTEDVQQFHNQVNLDLSKVKDHVKEDVQAIASGNVIGSAQIIANNAFDISKTISDQAIDNTQKITKDVLSDIQVNIMFVCR